MFFRFTLFLIILCVAPLASTYSREFLKPQDILKISSTPAEHRIHYGKDPKQIADLRVPYGKGPFPVLVVIHGGCWTSKMANLEFMSAFSEALTKRRVATWNIEYRCFDDKGGGWPGTFQDVGNAIDHLRVIAKKYDLDLTKVIVVGHSAGGHLALWSGARHKIKGNSPLYKANPLKLEAVVNLAGIGDLKSFIDIQEKVCMDKVINKLLGDSPAKMNERLAQASPYELLPFKTRQVLITGEFDEAASVQSMEHYLKKAKESGDVVELTVVKDAAHFEVLDARRTHTWITVADAIMKPLD